MKAHVTDTDCLEFLWGDDPEIINRVRNAIKDNKPVEVKFRDDGMAEIYVNNTPIPGSRRYY